MATIAVTRERRQGETRVAATPDTVKKLIALGYQVVVEAGAGLTAAVPDAEYAAAGAEVVSTAAAALAEGDVVLKVRGPESDEIAALKPGAIVVALLNPYQERPVLDAIAAKG